MAKKSEATEDRPTTIMIDYDGHVGAPQGHRPIRHTSSPRVFLSYQHGRAELVRLTERGWRAWDAGVDALHGLVADLVERIGEAPLAALHGAAPLLLSALEARAAASGGPSPESP